MTVNSGHFVKIQVESQVLIFKFCLLFMCIGLVGLSSVETHAKRLLGSFARGGGGK